MSVFPIGSGGNTPHPMDSTHLSRGVLGFLDLAAGGFTSLGGDNQTLSFTCYTDPQALINQF